MGHSQHNSPMEATLLMKPGALNLAELIADSTRISELKAPDQDSHPGARPSIHRAARSQDSSQESILGPLGPELGLGSQPGFTH